MVLLWGVVSGSTETLTPGCGVGVVPETVPQSLQPPLPPDAGVGVSAGCAGAAVYAFDRRFAAELAPVLEAAFAPPAPEP